MKTGLDMVLDGLSLIDVPEVNELIDGVVIALKRPFDSDKTDVVVNSLSLSNRPLQEGTFNVNIHCPNLKNVKYGNTADTKTADIVKMKAISDVIIPLLECRWMEDFHTDIEVPPEPIQDNDGTWYLNIRVNYYSSANNYQNI